MQSKYKHGVWREGVPVNEHTLTAERALGRRLKTPEQVHHVDYNKRNNAPDNLVICPDMAYHKLLHMRTDAMNACGNPDYRKCPYCQVWDSPNNLALSYGVSYHNYCKNKRNQELKV